MVRKYLFLMALLLLAIVSYAQEYSEEEILEIIRELPPEQQQQIASGELDLNDLPKDVREEIITKILVSGLFDKKIQKSLDDITEKFNSQEVSAPVRIFFNNEDINVQIGIEEPLKIINLKFEKGKIVRSSLGKAEKPDLDLLISKTTFINMVTGEHIDLTKNYLDGNIIFKSHGFLKKLKYGMLKLAIKVVYKFKKV